INQLACYPDAIAGFSDAPLEDVSDSQFPSYLLDIDGLPLERETRISGDHKELLVAGKGRNDLLDHSVCKVFLLRIAAHVLEWKDSNGWPVGQDQWLLSLGR